jgi:chromosome condensin MukBEF MukE localization factor
VTTKSVLAIGFVSQIPSREDFVSAHNNATTEIARSVLLRTSVDMGRVLIYVV